MPSSAELAKARRRRRKADLSSAVFTVGFGSMLFFIIECISVAVNDQPRASLLRQADLAITPSDGIAVVAALVAVVLSINLALAVLTRPDNPIEEVLSTDWQLAMAMVCAFCAGFSVMTVLMCWFSSQRSHSWGALISATALAFLAEMLAALVWTRARAVEYAKVEVFRLRRRRDRLNRAVESFQRRRPHRRHGFPMAIGQSLLLASLTALVTTAIACLVAITDHQSVSLRSFEWFVLIAFAFQAPLLLSGCTCWLHSYAEGPLDRISDTVWIVLITVTELGLIIGLVVLSPRPVVPIFATYGCCLLAVPGVLLIADHRLGRFGWLTGGLRAFAGRQLTGRLRQTKRELKAARKLRRRLRPKPIEQRNELLAVSG